MIKIGIIGAGPNAEGHARYYAATPRSQVVAIADPDTGRAMSLADQTGGRSTPDFRDFLDEVDAVVISSPNFLHREHAIACAEAGKAVYCEKPAGLNLEDARAIADAVRKARVVSTVGFTVRFDGTIQTMDRMLRAGELGDLISLTSRRLMYMSPAK